MHDWVTSWSAQIAPPKPYSQGRALQVTAMGTAQTQSAGWQGSTVQGSEGRGIPYQPLDLNMLSLMLLAAQGVLATSVWKHSAADVVRRITATCGIY